MASDQPIESFSNSRRDFIKLAASGTAVASTLSTLSVSASQDAAARLAENAPRPYDLVINGGRCVDPETGLEAVRNVGIKGGRIAAISD
jgi:N-acyl-D-glutamate deacylase